MMMKKIIVSSLIGVLLCLYSFAQEFNFQAKIKKVDTSGFHKVILNPFLLGQLNSNKGDLRIYDEGGIEIPYLFTSEVASSSTAIFREYQIIEKHFKENEVSYLIFQNLEKKKVNNISIMVQNTDVRKRARLSGSNDKKTWYVIKNDFLLHSMANEKETSELKILNFPLSDYAYFKLEIDDYWKLPIHILKVGYYDFEYLDGKIVSFDIPFTLVKGSLHTSNYEINFNERLYLENIKFTMTGADFYNRYTTIFVKKYSANNKGKNSHFFSRVASFELNSNSNNTVSFTGISTDTLYVEIQNLDDQPLTMKKVTGSYLNQYVVANFSPNKTYTIKFGSETVQKPRYDLAAFQDKIPNKLKMIGHQLPQRINKASNPQTREKGFFENQLVIWVFISLVGLLIAWVSIKMVKEIGNE